eukprot:CAMPEP_0119481674 /NCGR_PEP_ID=MMETSP1344-20130328/9897_1 /TAXON_ID=236787 /ORGANISM="Florenciella parvula, Strain CCMP2471" /LENGTH=1488 /DNA_ID=CAMNT_0007516051 /DNA_START=55 /DNA_END=4518 /DNA_ORIENTATION=-
MSARASGTRRLTVVSLMAWTMSIANAAPSGWKASALSQVPTRPVPVGSDGTLSRDNHNHTLHGGWGREPVASRANLHRALGDGSGCFGFTLDMTDTWGDGWGNFVYMLADAQGNLEYSGTLASGSSATQDWCLEPDYYIFSIPNSDEWGSEVEYSFCGISGSGVDSEETIAYETIVVNGDGTCESHSCAELTMTDEYGDGWQGHVYSITDEDGNVVISDQPQPHFSTKTATICLGPGVYTFEVGGDDFDDDDALGSPSEIGWSLCGASGGVGVQESFIVHSDGTCGQIGEGSVSYSYSYSYDSSDTNGGGGGGSSCPTSSPAVTMTLTDEYGDGWQGHVYSVIDETGNVVESEQVDDHFSSMTVVICLDPGIYTFEVGGDDFDDDDALGSPSEIGWWLCGTSGAGVGDANALQFVLNEDGTCEDYVIPPTSTPTWSPTVTALPTTKAPTPKPSSTRSPTPAPTACDGIRYECLDGTVLHLSCTGQANASSVSEMRCLVEELGASDLAGADQPITIALNKSLVLDAPITVPAGANVRLTGASDLDTGGRRRLQGLASDGTSISGGLSSRLFAVSDGSTLEIKDVALLGGFHTESGGAILVEGGSLYLTSCLVQGSYSEANGGAVHVAATAASAVVKVMDSMFDANSAEGDGGALSIEKDGTGAAEVAISGTIFQDNTATERGGALRAESYSATDTIIVAINGGLFQGNEANGGGAAYFQKATLHLGGSELRDNSALGGMEAHGGALNLLQSTLDATNVTAVGNSAEERGGCIFMDSASFVDLSDSVLERNTAGTFGGAICNYGGSTLDVYTSKLLFNNATDGSEVYNDNSDFYARESWFEDSVAQVGDYVLHAEKGALVLDTCTVRSADELAVASDFAATLRNTDVFGDVFLTGGAGRLAACADLSDPWNDLSCSEQYCSDAPAGGYGIRCYCDTVHGPQDPMTGSCEDPPQIYVLQDVFDLYALKPASVETDVFFVNQGDKPLFWKVELADWPGPHEWAFSPQTGNLSTCETGNFSIRLDAFNVTAYRDYEIRLNIVSSSYPFSISEDYSVYSPVNTSVNVGVQYYFEAVANASLSHLAPVGKTLAATAGEYLEVLVKPVDNDGLWIRGSGSDHFRASLHRSGDGAGGRDGTVCAVGYESGLDMHQIMCLLDPFQAGLFELSVTVGQDAVPVGDSPYEVAVGCGDEFTEVNGTCGCAPGHRLEVETVQCIACAKGKYGASYATVDAPNPCRKCVEFVQLSTTATDGASSLAQCICSPGYFYLEAEENCVPCLEGGACPDYGHTLRSIVIQSEYWRSSDNSSVTLYCENHPSLCIGDMVAGDGEAGIGDDVDDRGDCDDPETGRLCRCHHKGPYCEVCTGEGERYKSLEGSCIECKEVNRGNVIGAIIALVLILVLGTAGAIYGAWLQVKDFDVKERELKKAYHKPGAGDGAPANVVSKDNDISEEERDAVVMDDYQGRMVGEASVMATLAMAAAQNLPGVGGSGGGGA